MTDLARAKELLKAGEYTCVICKEEQTYTSTFRGVKPLVKWYVEEADFLGFSAADKVVGKATAFLYQLHRVKAVYAGVISESALDVLQQAGIKVEYGTLVEHIINRTGDGICPFEQAVLAVDDEKEAYEAIRRKMQQMNIEL